MIDVGHPLVGQTYRFNQVLAVVASVGRDEIVWRFYKPAGEGAPQKKRSPRHRTPRWYFEKYSVWVP